MEINTINLDSQAKKFMTLAKKYGVEKNFLFVTNFKQYMTLIKISLDLEKTLKNEGYLTTKEYVKDRKNIYTHPALPEYRKTVESIGKISTVLMNIILKMKNDDKKDKNSIDKLKADFIKAAKNKKADFDDDLSDEIYPGD